MNHTPHIHRLMLLIFVTVISGVFSYFSIARAAFGTSPPWVKNDNLTPGTTFEQKISLSRSEADKAMKANFRITGDKELVKWITIENEKNMILKEGQTALPIKVIVEVPKRAELKNYRGGIYVSLSGVEADDSLGGGQVGINLGANISVNITVTGEKVYEYKVTDLSVSPIWEKTPLVLNVDVQNLGNVPVTNINGQMDIYNETQKEILQSLDFIALNEPIAVNKSMQSKMIYEDILLDGGNYWIFVKVFLDGKTTYENRLALEVKPRPFQAAATQSTSAKKPQLPQPSVESDTEETEPIQIPLTDMRSSAPVISENNGIFLIFGLAGLGFGLIALLGVIIVLVVLLKNQQRNSIIGYPVQTFPVIQAAPAMQTPVAQTPIAQVPPAVQSDPAPVFPVQNQSDDTTKNVAPTVINNTNTDAEKHE